MVVTEKAEGLTERLEEEPFGGCTLRVRKARQRYLGTPYGVCLERARIMTEVFMKTEGEPLAVRKAEALRELCGQGTIFLQDDELIVGNPGSKICVGILNPETDHSILSDELDTLSTRPIDPYVISEDQIKLFKECIGPYWRGKSFKDIWKARVPDEIRQLEEALVFSSRARVEASTGGFVGNHALVIKIGIKGLRRRINDKLASLDAAIAGDYEKIVYLNALLIVCEGIETRAKRYARLAREKAAEEKDPLRKAELEKIAEICQWVPANPARTFWEALQSLWFYQITLWMDHSATSHCPGRVDQYLYPYYKKDIEEGRLTREQAQELLECLWVKFSELQIMYGLVRGAHTPGYASFQNITCGGVTESGQDGVNELSYMMLQATMDVRLPQPHISVKYNRKNPESFLRKAAELSALGMGHPPFLNDELGIQHVMDRGIPFEEAYNWSPKGCFEVALAGKIGMQSSPGESINLAAAVELTLLNGVHRKTKTRLPVPQTGDPRNFKTYEEFKDAVKIQLAYSMKRASEAGQMLEVMTQEQRVVLVTSLGHEECIERAKDVTSGGAKYNPGPEFYILGTGDIVNSLAAIKKLIYEDKKLTWDELLAALDNDFEGYEQIRQMCLSAPKYGNDIPEVDEIATEITFFLGTEVRQYKGLFGGRRLLMSAAAGDHLPPGEVIGALPSGRKAWEPLADAMSPMQGTDTKGPTAVLKSFSKCANDVFTTGALLNMKLDPSLFKDERGIGAFMSLLKSAHDLDVYQVQFNIVSTETLRKAQRHPEEYRNLLVRVSGYSCFFVELYKNIQDEIISRTTQGGLA